MLASGPGDPMVTDVAPPGAAQSERGLADAMLTGSGLPDFRLPAEREARAPPEARGVARDGVRLLVSRRGSGQISQHVFRDLPGLLLPGDLLVVNSTGTLPAQLRAGGGLAVHFCSPRPDGGWLVELRQMKNKSSRPNGQGCVGQVISLPGGAALTLQARAGARLWPARLSGAGAQSRIRTE